MGREIYPSNLDCLKTDTVASDAELYFYDTIVDCYIPILLHKFEHTLHPIKGFSADSVFISNIHLNQALEHIAYFLRHKVPDKDIVFFPIFHNKHITCIVVINNLKVVLYLDSLGGISKTHLNFVLKVYKLYYEFNKIPFDFTEWSIITPKDTPRRKTSYDCGAYICMFAKTILRQSMEPLRFHYESCMDEYRNKIRRTLLSYMKKTLPPPRSFAFNKQRLKKYKM